MLAPEHEDTLRHLLRVFLEENRQLNLSAHRTEEQCWNLNILDSLAFLDVLPRLQLQTKNFPLQTLDLGTGGGFPLLPLAICMPENCFTGLDATRKKVLAIERIVKHLGLLNVTALWGRAESLGKDPAHTKNYDIVFARAVAKLPELLALAIPFLKPGGSVIFWKSMYIGDELRLAEIPQKPLGFSLMTTHRYELPGNYGERQLLIFQKTPHALHYHL